MNRFPMFLAIIMLSACAWACEPGDEVGRVPGGCFDDADCDDGVPCTLDLCAPTAGICVHPAKTCEDGDACTLDLCDPATGACSNPKFTCDDRNLCTTDTCDGAAGCVFAPVTCPGDGDLCTVAHCSPETGECVHLPKECNDNNACTVDSCEGRGECIHTPVTNGTPCILGADFTSGSICMAGDCLPMASISYGIFRIDSMTLVSPTVLFDVGNGPEVVNSAISAYLTSWVNGLEGGGLVALFESLPGDGAYAARSSYYTTITLGEGDCLFQSGDLRWCGLREGGARVLLTGSLEGARGRCWEDPVVVAPCFRTQSFEFNLHGYLPDIFPENLGYLSSQAYGNLPGNPAYGIEGGWAVFRVPTGIMDRLSVTLNGRRITGAELMKDVPVPAQYGGLAYDVRVSFTAVRTALRPDDCHGMRTYCSSTAKCVIPSCDPDVGCVLTLDTRYCDCLDNDANCRMPGVTSCCRGGTDYYPTRCKVDGC